MNKHSNGFTLIEMSLVIALMVGMALFAVQETVNDYELKVAENHAMDMMTIANAAVSFVYDDADYNWPRQASGPDGCDGLVAELNNKYFFFKNADANDFTTTCDATLYAGSFSPVLKITKSYGSDKMAEIISGLLPAVALSLNATVDDGDLTMFVLKPRGGEGSKSGVAIADQLVGGAMGAIIEKPACASALKLFVKPNAICSNNGFGVKNYRIKQNEQVTEWWIHLEVDTTKPFSSYVNVSECDSDDIEFEYRISCGGGG